ncbi:hypothetical protein P7K49_029119, partial [Saguinus oedipus]
DSRGHYGEREKESALQNRGLSRRTDRELGLDCVLSQHRTQKSSLPALVLAKEGKTR